MRYTPILLALALSALATPALPTPALAADRLTVVELFTSQGCSSCPPADALLARLAQEDPNILPLDMHVTYWDRLGWKDPFSLPAATQRQREVSARLGLGNVYTPQLVVDGRHEAIGSDPADVRDAIAAARNQPAPEIVPVTLSATANGLQLQVGPGARQGVLLLIGFDRRHDTPVRAGENGGRTLSEVNVVRSIAPVATWSGAPLSLSVPRPPGDRVAVLLQGEDGRMLGVAVSP